MVVAMLLVLCAVPVGLLVLRPAMERRSNGEGMGIKTEHMVAPLVTLAVFMSAFVVAQATVSWGRANDQTGAEAGAVDNFFETAGMLPGDTGVPLQAATVCYARAVAHREWDAMADGRIKAPEVKVWTTRFRHEIPKVLDGPSSVVGSLLTLDRQRSEARRLRLAEATPSIPGLVFILMFSAITLAVLALSAFAVPSVPTRNVAVIVTAIALLLGGTLVLVDQLEQPYTGVVQVHNDAMVDSAVDALSDFAAEHPGAQLPCDRNGVERSDS